MIEENHAPASRLWSLSDGARGYGVVRADDEPGAWAIVRALQETGDVPDAPFLSLHPSSADVARRVGRVARRALVKGHYLACLGDGMFIIQVGGLGAAYAQA